MPVIVPFTPLQASEPEPEAILRFGDIEIRLGLTYLHHLRNCHGWGDSQSLYFIYDSVMRRAMEQIEEAMWREIDKKAGR